MDERVPTGHEGLRDTDVLGQNGGWPCLFKALTSGGEGTREHGHPATWHRRLAEGAAGGVLGAELSRPTEQSTPFVGLVFLPGLVTQVDRCRGGE